MACVCNDWGFFYNTREYFFQENFELCVKMIFFASRTEVATHLITNGRRALKKLF